MPGDLPRDVPNSATRQRLRDSVPAGAGALRCLRRLVPAAFLAPESSAQLAQPGTRAQVAGVQAGRRVA